MPRQLPEEFLLPHKIFNRAHAPAIRQVLIGPLAAFVGDEPTVGFRTTDFDRQIFGIHPEDYDRVQKLLRSNRLQPVIGGLQAFQALFEFHPPPDGPAQVQIEALPPGAWTEELFETAEAVQMGRTTTVYIPDSQHRKEMAAHHPLEQARVERTNSIQEPHIDIDRGNDFTIPV